jgi:hypothetical protein
MNVPESKLDEYAKQLLRQNSGLVCDWCKSALGHYSFCSLLSREVAEAHSTQRSKADALYLHGLGVKWSGDYRTKE